MSISNVPLPSAEEIEETANAAEKEQEQPKYPQRKKRYIETEDEGQEGSTVRVFNEDDKFRKRLPIQIQGLSSEMIPPITKRKVARYEVCGKDKIDPLTGQIISPVPPLSIPGKYVIYDPFDPDVLKRHKTLKNVTRFENVNRGGVMQAEEVVEDIYFENGMLNVAIEKNFLVYVLLELHPLNETNRWRDKSQAPAFRRTDIGSRKWSETNVGMDLAFEAEKTVIDMRSVDEIISWAHAAGIPTQGRMIDGGDSSVRFDLRKFARSNPKDFFSLNKNADMAIRIAVMDANDLGLIDYIVDSRKWQFSTDGEFIGNHLPGEEPMDALIKLFRKEAGKKAYTKLQHQLNYWS